MSKIHENLAQVKAEILKFATCVKRNPKSITLLAVSKTKPEENIIEAYKDEQRLFGESYAKEASDKIDNLKKNGFNDIEWHFIGPLQSNKTKLVAERFDVVESLDRIKIAERLNAQRPDNLPPLKVLIQVNIGNEEQKSGIPFSEIENFAKKIVELPHLKLAGLMGIAKDTLDKNEISREFRLLKNSFDNLQKIYPHIFILSMGMTHDMGEAIAEGSTEIRIGTAIFGPRNYNV